MIKKHVLQSGRVHLINVPIRTANVLVQRTGIRVHVRRAAVPARVVRVAYPGQETSVRGSVGLLPPASLSFIRDFDNARGNGLLSRSIIYTAFIICCVAPVYYYNNIPTDNRFFRPRTFILYCVLTTNKTQPNYVCMYNNNTPTCCLRYTRSI